MLENVVDKFEIYRTDDEIKQFEAEKRRIINTIKLFMVGGAEFFYLNYYLDGDKFLDEGCVDKNDVKETIKFSKNAKKHFKNGILTKNEEIEEMLKYRYLSDVVEWEKEKNIDFNMLRIFKYVANSIVGNIGYMFMMLQQIDDINDLEYDLVEETEMNVYASLGKMFCYLGKQCDKYSVED